VHKAPRTGDVKHSLASVKLARQLIGYVPKVGFEEGLERTFSWYREASATSGRR
jgi:nucleoside-diphosphate-sugar epimerase